MLVWTLFLAYALANTFIVSGLLSSFGETSHEIHTCISCIFHLTYSTFTMGDALKYGRMDFRSSTVHCLSPPIMDPMACNRASFLNEVRMA